jgi:D-lactate dehydrogenase
MRVGVFSARRYEVELLEPAAAEYGHELDFFEARLSEATAKLADGLDAVCAFVNDQLGRKVLERLKAGGTRLIALRSAGFNHVDLTAADELGLTVVRVPAYSPHAVAEHTVALLLSLNRKIHRAYHRVREGNFALDGLMGFDLHGRTAGVVGTGKIGRVVIRILRGFGMRILAHDRYPDPDVEAEYVALPELFNRSDVVTLHCPLTPDTHHLIDEAALAQLKPRAILLNTSRGPLVDTRAVIASLKCGRLGALGLDVYEEEGDLFFEDLSNEVIQDDTFSRLLTFPNVLITGHQAFFTRDAMLNIVNTTLQNISDFETRGSCDNTITAAQFKSAATRPQTLR